MSFVRAARDRWTVEVIYYCAEQGTGRATNLILVVGAT